jgi:hypothetical protein
MTNPSEAHGYTQEIIASDGREIAARFFLPQQERKGLG